METMKKLIELDAALEGLENLNAISFYEANEHSKEAYMETKGMLKALPTVDAVTVRHGHWVRWYEEIYDSFGIGYAPHYKCSECDTEYDQYDAMRMNYCPNCGVKLDGKDGDT